MEQVTHASRDRPGVVDGPDGARGHLPLQGAMTANPVVNTAPARSGVLGEVKLWLVSLILFAPALLPYASHFTFQLPGRLPTGFVDYDLPYYMANAREHFDSGRFHFFYSNPYDPNYASPAIYVQPMTLALGTVMHLTGLAPNVVFLIFELLAGWVCARVAVALYAEVVGLDGWARRLGLAGLLLGRRPDGARRDPVLAGHSRAPSGSSSSSTLSTAGGASTSGATSSIRTEALYHALFFGCILSVLRRKYWYATVLALLLSWSHPFSGVELLLILVSWSAFELFFVQSGAVPIGFFGALLTLLVLHFGYYVGYLRRFPEHRALMETWSLPWLLQASNFVPAYALVGALAAWSFRRLELARTFFANARNRLFLVWFLVAFALANHEFAIKPIQPLHFTRGYIWTPLFLMGSTALVGLFTTLRSRGGPVLRSLAIGSVVAVLLLDNAVWFGSFSWEGLTGDREGLVASRPTSSHSIAG